MKIKINNLIKLENCIYLCCCFACLYQIEYVVVKYLSFDFITRINLFVPEKTNLPDLVLCSSFTNLINFTKLIENHPEVAKNLNITNIDDYNRLVRRSSSEVLRYIAYSLTLKQITSILITADTLIGEIQIMDQSSKETPDLCQLKTYYISTDYCFQISCSYRKAVSTSVSMADHLAEQMYFFYIALRTKYLHDDCLFFATLVKPNTLPWDDSLGWLTIDTFAGPYRFSITFSMYYEQNLPPPHPSQCHNYSDDGYMEQAEALNDCFNRHSLRKFGYPFYSTLIPDDMKKHHGINIFAEGKPNFTELNKLTENCFKITSRVDCIILTYPIADYSKLPSGTNKTILTLDLIKDPVLVVVNEPAMTLSDCCISIGSILGSWFGFSISYHIPLIIKQSYDQLKQYLDKKRHIRQYPRYNVRSKSHANATFKRRPNYRMN